MNTIFNNKTTFILPIISIVLAFIANLLFSIFGWTSTAFIGALIPGILFLICHKKYSKDENNPSCYYLLFAAYIAFALMNIENLYPLLISILGILLINRDKRKKEFFIASLVVFAFYILPWFIRILRISDDFLSFFGRFLYLISNALMFLSILFFTVKNEFYKKFRLPKNLTEEQKLKRLMEAYSSNLISEEEYQKLRADIINSI